MEGDENVERQKLIKSKINYYAIRLSELEKIKNRNTKAMKSGLWMCAIVIICVIIFYLVIRDIGISTLIVAAYIPFILLILTHAYTTLIKLDELLYSYRDKLFNELLALKQIFEFDDQEESMYRNLLIEKEIK